MKSVNTPQLRLGILLLFQSWELQIMDDCRVLVKGNVVDSENNARL